MTLRILAAGGTFDKRYDPISGTLGFGDTHLHEIVARARLAQPVTVEVAMLIDSLEMTEQHRQVLLERCRAAAERAIVIVHGTDTMVETAGVLGQAGLDKRIVLTGAMQPYSVAGSDALFNLGFAMGWAAGAEPGVWVAMNGVAHVWHDVRKNRERGVFEPLSAGQGPDQP
ncbi:MAG: asparaginase [Burkholderiales bacterium]|nr:asparaginase [Burkholderiales bacterium]